MQTPQIHNAQHELVDAMRRLQIAQRAKLQTEASARALATEVTRLQVEVDEKRVALERAVADEIEATRSERSA